MDRRSRRWIEWLAVAVGALLVVWILAQLDGPAPALLGDQVAINLMVVKSLHPDWLQGDSLYGSGYSRFYTPSFTAVQTALAGLTGGDPVAALRILLWPVGLLFLLGHYALFRSVTGHPLAAALGAVGALAIRNALGGEYWGFSGIASVQPRAVAEGLAPLLVLAFLRWRSYRSFPIFFLLVGGVANLHPVSGFHLAQVTALTHLWLSRFDRRAWGEIAAGAGLFTLGALPFLLRYLPGKENLADPALLPVVREALNYRFYYLLLPQRLDALLSVAFHAALPAILLIWLRRRGAWPADFRVLAALGAAALIAGFGGIALIQAAGRIVDRPYLDIMQIRAAKFMYLPLLAAFPLAYRALLSRRAVGARIVLALMIFATLIPPGWVIHSFSEERRESVKRLLGMAVPARPSRERGADEDAARKALSKWVIENTERNDLFLADSPEFREETLRPITGAFKDGAYVVLAGTAPFYRWYIYIREVESCRAREGAGCWFELARKYRAMYVVVDPGLRQAATDGDFVQAWSQSGWLVWRRVEAPAGAARPMTRS